MDHSAQNSQPAGLPLYERIFGEPTPTPDPETTYYHQAPSQAPSHHAIEPNNQPDYWIVPRVRTFDIKNLATQRLRKEDILKEDNWLTWKSRVLRTLRGNGLEELVLGTWPPPDRARDPAGYSAWHALDHAVVQFLQMNISSDQLANIPGGLEINGISSITTSAHFWRSICDAYESHSYQMIINTLRRMNRMQATESTDILRHLNEMHSLRTTLANVSYSLDDHIFNGIVLASLPDSWDAFTTSIQGMQGIGFGNSMSTINLFNTLRSEYHRRQGTSMSALDQTYRITGGSRNSGNSRKRKRDSEPCRICGYTNHATENCKWKKQGGYCTRCRAGGHWTSRCPYNNDDRKDRDRKGKGKDKGYKSKGKGRENANTARANASLDVDSSSSHSSSSRDSSEHVKSMVLKANATTIHCYDSCSWLADTATTSHIASEKKDFTVYRKIDRTITGVGDARVKAVGCGSVILTSHVDGETHTIALNDVLHVPSATDNLLSVGRFVERGNTFVATKFGAFLFDSNESLIATAKLDDSLFHLDVKVTHELSNVSKPVKYSWMEWHKRFGHIAVSGLQHLRRRNLVDGFDVDESSELQDCEACVRAKQTENPFSKSATRSTTSAGELTHTDVWGPARFNATNGARYYMTFIDDYSRHCTIKLLNKKSEAAEMVKGYLAFIERHLGLLPKAIRADNGKEYINNDLKSWLNQRGILLDSTAPYSPQQNGIAERYNRTLADLIRAMLCEKKIPKVLWGTAVLHACYLRNRAYTRTLSHQTPLERWCGKRPDVASFHEFGTPVSILNQGVGRDKLDPRGDIHIFVGFEEGPHAIRYFDITTRQVKISRNYHFLPHSDNPPQFEGEYLGENESLWELPSDLHVSEEKEPEMERESRPLIIRIPKRPHTTLDDEDDEDTDKRAQKRQRTKSSHSFISSEQSLYSEIVYTAFNDSGLAPENPKTLAEAKKSDEWPEWEKAIETELEQLRKMGTWELVDLPEGRHPVGNKWVFLRKFTKTGELEKYKARLVAKGYSQIPGMDFYETFAPVIRMETIRLMLALAVTFDTEITQMDVKGAYLNGHLEEEVYMRQPDGYQDGTGKVCRLIKTLYGLKQAGREWNKEFDARLKGLGFMRLHADPCAYIRAIDDHLEVITAWVDDLLLFADTAEVMQKLKKELKTVFELTDMGEPQKIVGIEIDRDRVRGTLKISQAQYIDNLLAKYNMTDCNPVATPMDPSVNLDDEPELPEDSPIRELYASLVGSLMFLAIATRVDIACTVRKLAVYISRPGQAHWKAAKRVLRYLKGTKSLGITFVRANNPDKKCLLRGYSDASFNSESDGKSVTGYAFILAGGAISWGSRKQGLTALSTTEAECLALTETAQEASWLRTLLDELKLSQHPTPVYEDNQGTIALAANPQFHRRSKHFNPKLHFIREKIVENQIMIHYCPTDQMTADVLTKALPKDAHQAHVRSLGLASD